MIASDSFRSRAYIQLLVKNEIIPNHIIIISDKKKSEISAPNTQDAIFQEYPWKDLIFDPLVSIYDTIKTYQIKFEKSSSYDINSDAFKKILQKRQENIYIYSGLPGVLLKEHLFKLNKFFLHSHGGYLPNYKGSTTNYYSLLENNTVAASTLFLNNKIDGGDVLKRFCVKLNDNRELIDNIFDPMIRAKVLIDTIKDRINNSRFIYSKIDETKNKTYYIIHPVLKHVAILDNEKK